MSRFDIGFRNQLKLGEMVKYFVELTENGSGNLSFHHELCENLPEEWNRMYIGKYDNCSDALKGAHMLKINPDTCEYCTKATFTSLATEE